MLFTTGKRVPMELRIEPSFGRAVVDALSNVEAATARDIARTTGASELIVRSVLEALTYVGGARFDPATGRYTTYFSLGR